VRAIRFHPEHTNPNTGHPITRWANRAFALILALLLWPIPATAYRYHIHTYGEADGLPNQAVYGIDQTPDGRIWLATRKGLVAYDGLTWTSVMPESADIESGLRGVVVDEGGRIWIANLLTPAQVSWYEDGNWHRLPPTPEQSRGLDVDRFDAATAPDGSAWVTITTSDRRLLVWEGGSWTVHDLGPQIGTVYAIRHQGGSFLLASAKGLWVLPMEPGAKPQLDPGREARPCYGLAVATDGGLWIVEDGAAVYRGPNGREEVHEFPQLSMGHNTYGVSATVDPRGGLYVGTPWQLIHYHPDRGHEVLGRESGLAAEGAEALFADREGNVWVGAMRGLSNIVSRQLRTLDHRQGLLDDEVSAILRLRDGRMLLGHEHGLTLLEDPPRPLRLNVNRHLRSRLMDLVEAKDGTIWAAMDRHGLARITPAGDVDWHRPPAGPSGAVYTVIIDSEDTLWIGGGDGLGRMVDDRFEPVPLPVRSNGHIPFVRRLSTASDGGIYIMTGRDGVFHLLDGVFRTWDKSSSPGGLSAYCALERPDGTTWVGTAAGIRRLGDGRLDPVTDLEPILRRPVYAMKSDRAGRVWLGTDEGLRIWDGEILTSIRVGDGLAGSEINRDGLWLDHDGSMWVGTDRGVTRFEVDYLAEPRALPLVEFTGFDIDGSWIPDGQPQQRRGPLSILVAHFRGISFVDEARIRYRTWLEGFEADWQPLTSAPQRQLRYTNIPPGRYRFHVQAVGMHGEESSIAVSSPLTVVPPIWRTWWFLTGVAVLGVGLIGVVMALVIGRRNEHRLERLVQERTARLNEMEQTARAESARMSTTLQSISDGVLAVDRGGRLVLANRAATAMLGEEADQLVGRALDELLPTLAGIETTTAAPVVVRHQSRGNGEMALEATVAPLGMPVRKSSGKVIALRDITDRCRFEEEMARAQRLESLGVLAGGIAHDFNNLLAVVLGNTSLLEMADLSAANLDAVSRIRLSSEKARSLTQQLLTFARGGEPRLEPTPLGPLIDDMIALVMSGANATCRCDLQDDLRPAMIDADQVGQVLGNLLINSCQAMPDGGEITITGRNLPVAPDWLEAGDYVELGVSDEGPGLPEEGRERIFEPFYTTKPDGNGLGLAVAYSVARRHGGGLTAGASPSGGATFTLVLPAASADEVRRQQPADSASPRCGRILVMDDDAAVCTVIVQMLESFGSEAVGVADGVEALISWREAQESGRPFDLAILDLTVPGTMGGRETLKELQALQPDVRALVASGYSNDEVLADPPAFGFAGAIVKPFDTATLARAVQAVLGTASKPIS
jgi:PAS domain S-box-containing protein